MRPRWFAGAIPISPKWDRSSLRLQVLAEEFIREIASDTPLEGPWLIRDADHCFYAEDSPENHLSFPDVVLVDGENRFNAFRKKEHASSMWIVEQWGRGRYLWIYNGNGRYGLADLG